MKIWNDKEVCALFETVEHCKKDGRSLIWAFSEHARKFYRKPNSVRNYYYHEVDNLANDSPRAARLHIDVSKHSKMHFESFDKVQEGDLFAEIDSLTEQGFSVRAACLKLSGGDLSLMTRYQNKYQNMKKKLENYAKNGVKKQRNETKVKKAKFDATQLESKIIPFKIPRTLSDADINSLFLGLVRLIKKTAQDEASESMDELRQNALEKDKKFLNLKNEFEKIKQENVILHQQIKEISRSNKKLVLEKKLAHGYEQNKQNADA